MRFCPDCGDPHQCAAELERDDAKTKIRLAEIERDKAIRIAEIEAGTMKTDAAAAVDIAEAEILSAAARAEGEATGMETVLDSLGGGGEPAPEEPPVIELATPDPGEPAETTPAPEDAPPVRSKGGSTGWWDPYR
jgi:hypothetical protein